MGGEEWAQSPSGGMNMFWNQTGVTAAPHGDVLNATELYT